MVALAASRHDSARHKLGRGIDSSPGQELGPCNPLPSGTIPNVPELGIQRDSPCAMQSQ